MTPKPSAECCVRKYLILKIKEYLQQKQNYYCPIDNIQRIKLAIG